MPHYRIYHLTDAGRIRAGEDATCDDDAEALEAACQRRSPGQAVEVWCGTRCIGRVPTDDVPCA